MFLEKIIAYKQNEVEEAKRVTPLQSLEKLPQKTSHKFLFHKAIAAKNLTLIAEVKKASPSKGLLCPDFDPVYLAELYSKNGAGAISVLTDEHFFQGKLDYLNILREKTALPLLRKDFIIDPYQIIETATYPADAVLLIAAILDYYQLRDFLSLAKEVGLDCLTEVHNFKELEAALKADAPIIGINNRDLKTFAVDLKTSLQLVKEIPSERLKVSESGIFTRHDVELLVEAGFNSILVGEAIVKAADRPAKIKELALL